MDPSQANFRECQRQAIDTEIKSLKESIIALRYRRNTLAPALSLPPEVIAAIFSLLRVPVASSESYLKLGESLGWLGLSHVCHHWRQIALNQPLFWSHLNFNSFSWAGAAEILARAKTVPLYLEARIYPVRWDSARVSALQKELQARASYTRHLKILGEYLHLNKIVEGYVSPAPTLEYFSLFCEQYPCRAGSARVSVPDTLFDGTAPRLSRLELQHCALSWKSPLLKGLTYLDIRTPSANARPSLSVWLDALGEMAQLKTLTLHCASPHVPRGGSLPLDVERTVTLPSLTSLDISASARDCGLALAHLILPALTRLCLKARSFRRDGGDVLEVLPHFSRHAHGLQHTQPLQSVVDRSNSTCVDMRAWTVPGIDVKLADPTVFFDAMFCIPADFYSDYDPDVWSPETTTEIFNAAMAALPLDSLVTLTSLSRSSLFDEQSWLCYAPRWPLVQHLHLGRSAGSAFREMLMEDNRGRESPLLPSLTKIVLFDTTLTARGTLRLCDGLMKRVEQGVPLETLDLRNCFTTRRAVELLREIVVKVLNPVEPLDDTEIPLTWDSAARGFFVGEDLTGYGDYEESNPGHDDLWDNDDGIEYDEDDW